MALDDPNEDEDLIPPDTRRHRRLLDSRRQADGELSDSDDEGEGGRTNHAQHRDADSTSRSSGNEGAGGRKFGIMASAATALGAGPSGHSTVPRILASVLDDDDAALSMSGDDSMPDVNGSSNEKEKTNGNGVTDYPPIPYTEDDGDMNLDEPEESKP